MDCEIHRNPLFSCGFIYSYSGVQTINTHISQTQQDDPFHHQLRPYYINIKFMERISGIVNFHAKIIRPYLNIERV